jgi:hypothetical protein
MERHILDVRPHQPPLLVLTRSSLAQLKACAMQMESPGVADDAALSPGDATGVVSDLCLSPAVVCAGLYPMRLLRKEPSSTPWRRIFSNKHVWAIVVAHFCANWGFYTLLTWYRISGVHLRER